MTQEILMTAARRGEPPRPVTLEEKFIGEQEKEMETLTLTLHKTKDTKNKVVYGTADGTVIQSVYIDKDALGKEPPERVKVVISAE